MQKKELEERIQTISQRLETYRKQIGRRIIGQRQMIDGILMAIIAGGHVLLEGVPGLAKTLTVKTLADVSRLIFKRIQFTPDLLPADLIGTLVYRQQSGEFEARKGPVFSNIVLADEINRAPAKVQSALLEAMQEKQVTIGNQTHTLPQPFFVLATQNPIEQEGTYPLPEAQLDRFLMKLKVTYPSPAEELEVLRRMGVQNEVYVNPVLNPDQLREIKSTAEAVTVDERIEKYIITIVNATREKNRKDLPFTRFIEFGASPRATIHLYRCAKVKALFEKRTFVLPEDIKSVTCDVLRHRLILSYEAESEELESDDVLKEMLSIIPVP